MVNAMGTRRFHSALWIAGLAAGLFCGVMAESQAAGVSPSAKVATPPVKSTHARAAKARHAKAVAEPIPEPVRPPDPPPPDWPVNAKATPASVEWNGRDLSVAAANSSLQQILKDVSLAIGVKVDGMSGSAGDQRIFGNYGPAPARDVLTRLLDGSGYNVLMIGDQGEGTPRQILLTSKAGKLNQPGQTQVENGDSNGAGEEDASDDSEPVDQPDNTMHRPVNFPPRQPSGGRSPQQLLQEMQQRQMLMQQGVQPQPQPQ